MDLFANYAAHILLWVRESISVLIIIKALFGAITIKGMGHLWFVAYIVCCYVFTPLLYSIGEEFQRKDVRGYWISVGAICGFIFLYCRFFNSYFNPAWLTCYVLGFYMSKAKKQYCIDEKIYLMFITPFCFVSNSIKIYVEYFRNEVFTGTIGEIYSILLPYCHVFLGTFLFFVLLFIGRTDVMCKGVLRFSDKYSYQIYICHGFFVLSEFSIFENKFLPICLKIIIMFTVTLFSAIILKSIVDKMSDVYSNVKNEKELSV